MHPQYSRPVRSAPAFSITTVIVLALASISAATPVYLNTQNSPHYLPPSYDLSEAGLQLPCNHAEDHIQYFCRVSGGEDELEITVDSNKENQSWLSRAEGQSIEEFRTEERKTIEKYIKLAQSSHATHLTFLGNPNTVIRVACTQMPPHDHYWRHKKIGFLHIVDLLSILGVGIIALLVWVSTVIFGGGKGLDGLEGGNNAHEIKTRTHRTRRSTASLLFSPTKEEKRIA